MAFQQYNISPWLTPVRLAATSNQSGTYYNGQVNNGVGATFTYATGALTIDSVTVNVGDRVLLSAQTAANENGLYVCNVAGATGVSCVLQRAADQQCIEQLHTGFYVTVGAGTINAGGAFVMIEPKPARLGIDDLSWESQPAVGSVTFSGGASTANALAVFSDTAGNIKAADAAVSLGQNLAVTGTGVFSGALSSTAGNITSGSSGDAGTFISFPATAANGTLILAAANAGGAFNTTISNAASVGQSQVISIPDVGAATGQFLVKTAALVSGNFISASGTGGVVVDSGVPVAAGMNYTTVAITAAQFNGMYAAPKLLIAAPGANKLLVLHRLDLLMTYVSAAYAAGGVAAVQYDSTANGAGVIASTTLSAATFQPTVSTGFVFNLGVVPQTFSTCVNKGFYLSNVTGAFTTGDSTFVAHIWYSIIATV